MREKRHAHPESTHAQRRGLNDEQRTTLAEIEPLGWELKFVRRPRFQDVVPVVFDATGRHFAVIEPDGTLNLNPALQIRH